MKKKILVPILIVLLILIAILLGFFIKYEIKAHRNNNTIGAVETAYTTDETLSRIANIPYDEYIKANNAPKDAVTPDIDENAGGEENSRAINRAIAELSDNGGGTINIPAGEYKITTIELKSNITLFIPSGTKLISLNCEENEGAQNPLHDAVITATDARNITITGGGTICGSGISYTEDAENEEPLYALEEFNLYTRVIEARKRIRFAKDTARYPLVQMNNCTDLKINNIILNESASWTLVINGCDNADIHNVVIDNAMHVANTDGIDILGSSNVDIKKCFIATGDDGIVLKPIDKEITNISVSDCVISSFANCFKIGTETQYDVSNIKVNNCSFFIPDGMTYGYSGIAIESADGSNISNVNIDHIDMDGVSSPLLIWLGNRMKYDNNTVGSISDITISNVNAVNTEMPSAITGFEADEKTYCVENVTLKNFSVSYRDTKENLSVKNPAKELAMDDYPEITRVSHRYFIDHKYSSYWDLPCYGIFLRHTKNVDYSGYTCTPRECSELDFDYVED